MRGPSWVEMLTTDLAKQVPEVRVPVYFLHGLHDFTCSYSVAEAYFEQLRAPLKGFYVFAHSAHSPIFEEPGRAQEILMALSADRRLACTMGP